MALAGSPLRIVLLGHTGAGKSASGNTILVNYSFKDGCSPESVTKCCAKGVGFVENKHVLVVDTPGLNDTNMAQGKLKSEVEKCIEMCYPGPHAFLLVIRLTRFTKEQQSAVKWIQKNFGEGALKHTIVLFTGKDDLKGKTVQQFISQSESLQQLVRSCGGRFHCFNNNLKGSVHQVRELFSIIENMLNMNKAEHYSCGMYKSAQKRHADREREKQENEEKKKKKYEDSIRNDQTKKCMRGGGAALGAVGGAVGGCCLSPSVATVTKKVGFIAGGLIGGAVAGLLVGEGVAVSGVFDEVFFQET